MAATASTIAPHRKYGRSISSRIIANLRRRQSPGVNSLNKPSTYSKRFQSGLLTVLEDEGIRSRFTPFSM
jgi:hypothetical protein